MTRYACSDYIRVIACFLVVLLHVSALQFETFSPAWPSALVYDSLSRMAVPLFFMLSGFLLLDRETGPLSRFYLRRYVRILLPFVVICIIYYFTPQYAGYDLPAYLLHLATHYVDYHLWYVYALAGLYLTLPFFIKILHGPDGPELARLYLVIWVMTFAGGSVLASYRLPLTSTEMLISAGYLLPPAELSTLQATSPAAADLYRVSSSAADFISKLDPGFFYGFMGYFICAWLIKRHLGRFTRPVCLLNGILCLLSTIAMIGATVWYSEGLNRPVQTFFNNLAPLTAIQAISFFIFCCQFRRETALVLNLSAHSYWIYLLHILVLRFYVGFFSLPASWLSVIIIPLLAIAVFLTAWLVALPLRRLELAALKILHLS